MQQEIERVQIRQLVAFDLALADSGEVSFDALRGDFADEYRVMLRFERDQSDVGRVAFVAGTRVRDFDQLRFHNPSPNYLLHVTRGTDRANIQFVFLRVTLWMNRVILSHSSYSCRFDHWSQ